MNYFLQDDMHKIMIWHEQNKQQESTGKVPKQLAMKAARKQMPKQGGVKKPPVPTRTVAAREIDATKVN
jgi:hypothetical protein